MDTNEIILPKSSLIKSDWVYVYFNGRDIVILYHFLALAVRTDADRVGSVCARRADGPA